LHVAPCGFLRQRVIRTWRCLGFGCGHKVPCSLRAAEDSPLLLPDATKQNRHVTRSTKLIKGGSFLLPRRVMLSFRRVVALFR
jgi:hypothetical protein